MVMPGASDFNLNSFSGGGAVAFEDPKGSILSMGDLEGFTQEAMFELGMNR